MLGWQQLCAFTIPGKNEDRLGVQVSHSLAQACGSHQFSTGYDRERKIPHRGPSCMSANCGGCSP